MIKKGTLIIISGPSGVGKKTIIDEIIASDKINFFLSISMTTRQKRIGEEEAIDYFFVTEKQFKENIAKNNFLEWAEFAGNYYGTPTSTIFQEIDKGNNVVLEIEVQGAIQVMEKLKNMKYISIFIVPPSIKELKERLINRGTESISMIEKRLSKANKEMHQASYYKYIVTNDIPTKAARKIEEIILNNYFEE